MTLSEVSVPLAIPLLLYSTDLLGWLKMAKSTVLSFIIMCLCVMLVSTGVSLFWLDKLPDVSSLAGMMVGVYTGGTPNLTAIGMALEVSEETFILMNAADLVVGASYFFFLLSVGIRLFGKFLVPFKNPEPVNHLEEEDAEPFDLKQMASGLALTVLIVGSTVGLSLAIFSKMSVPFIILLITSFAVAASFNKKIRHLNHSYDMGNYLLLVFCVAMGSMANLQEMAQGSIDYVLFVGSIMILTVALHLLFCFFFKIDRDTTIVTSAAGLFGPVFIGPLVGQLDNKKVLLSGISTGIVGYAVGNYLGIGLAYLLKNHIF
jgi:uncharacterized membrane protein